MSGESRRWLRSQMADEAGTAADNQAECAEEEREEEGPEEEKGRQQETGISRGAGLALVCSRIPLKRSRMSVSPATGLIGLPENGFLGDFFECLGFIGIASESVIRDAMVSVMFATIPSRNTVLPPPPPPTEAVERGSDVVDSNCQVEGRWSKAVHAGSATLPRTTSTCLMWCAIALGALVRGSPLTHVERYVDLAEDSLDACSGSATLDLARTHIAMSFLQTLMGDEAKLHQNLQRADSVLNCVTKNQVPEFQRLRDLRAFVGKVGDFEIPTTMGQVALDGFWSEDAPIEKLPDVYGQEQVCDFILGADNPANTSLFQAAKVSLDKLYGLSPSAKVDGGEDDSGTPSSPKPSSGSIHLDMLPEMTRLHKYVQRSEMRNGVGGLIFYSIFGMVQTMNEDHAGAIDTFWRMLDIRLRYPGMLRLNAWLHATHGHLQVLASGPHRERYEELKAAYNLVRPEGSAAAPSYEEWRCISDICDHPDVFCRGLETKIDFDLVRHDEDESEEARGPSALNGSVVL